MAVAEIQPDVILREPEVRRMVGNLNHSTIWRLARDGDFPQPLKLGLRATGWRLSDIQAWIKSRVPGETMAERERAK